MNDKNIILFPEKEKLKIQHGSKFSDLDFNLSCKRNPPPLGGG